MTGGTYRLHGLVVRSESIPIAARPAPIDEPVDLVVELAAPRPALPPQERPAGAALASIADDDAAWLTVVRTGDDGGVTLHFHGVATVVVDADLRRVEVAMDPRADAGLATVLLGGTVLSVILMLSGHPVLHASAVEVADGRVLGFVGSSGMGKSTLATLTCRDGARLLADDVLRTDVADDAVVAFPGATAARLRPQAAPLAAQAAQALTTTSDGRTAASLRLAADRALELAALVVPSPNREITELVLEPITGVEAVLTLIRHPRIVGWRDPRTTAQALSHWAALVERVPLMRAQVPWGPPFRDGLGRDLVDLVMHAVG